MNQVANVEVFSQGEAVLSGEGQHVLHGPSPLVIPCVVWLVFGEGFQRTGNDLFGRVVAAGAELPLDQMLAARIEMNIHIGRPYWQAFQIPSQPSSRAFSIKGFQHRVSVFLQKASKRAVKGGLPIFLASRL
jgi:hypothetical protein